MSKLTTTAAALMSATIATLPFTDTATAADKKFAHPILDYTKGHTQYSFDFCVAVAEAMGTGGATFCRAAAADLEDELEKGPRKNEPHLFGFSTKDGQTVFRTATPPADSWNTATIPTCWQLNGSKTPSLVLGIAPDGYIYKIPVNGFKGTCGDYIWESQTSYNMLTGNWQPKTGPYGGTHEERLKKRGLSLN